jgi:23S rRNA (uracil1939-C5)-methyltransferase
VKKGEEIIIRIDKMKYPNVGIGQIDGQLIRIKGALTDQLVKGRISKKRSGKIEARLLEVVERSPFEQSSFCEHFNICGGCMLQTFDYKGQLELKKNMVSALFEEAGYSIPIDLIVESPEHFEYRNKMEFSFGDAYKDGPLTLGMHKKGHHHDVVDVPLCHLVDEDYRLILREVLNYAKKYELLKYNKRNNQGFLRHLVVRKSKSTGEIMIALSATTQACNPKGDYFDSDHFVEFLKGLNFTGTLASVLYVKNDGLGDVVSGETVCLYGKPYIVEHIMGLSFKINLHAFFQTNSLGAERLYQTAIDLIPELNDKTCFDLFSGTGTIGQIMATHSKAVYGIEWVSEAVEAARENAVNNKLDNCTFICGDVFEKLTEITEKPDVIVVDPPRSGMGEKTTKAVAAYDIPQIVYVSCNPATLLDDLLVFARSGYFAESLNIVDMFPWTGGVECVTRIVKSEHMLIL